MSKIGEGGGEVMEDAFQGVTEMFQAGAMIIVKYLFLYILLPEIAAIVIIGGVLKLRGNAFKLAMVGVTILCAYLFLQFGLPHLANETTALSQNGI
jgi:hypothetical protein